MRLALVILVLLLSACSVPTVRVTGGMRGTGVRVWLTAGHLVSGHLTGDSTPGVWVEDSDGLYKCAVYRPWGNKDVVLLVPVDQEDGAHTYKQGVIDPVDAENGASGSGVWLNGEFQGVLTHRGGRIERIDE